MNILNKKIIISSISWLLSIGLFDLILINQENMLSNLELLLIFSILAIGSISFFSFVINLEEVFHSKYSKVKATILSIFSLLFLLVFGIVLAVTPLVIFNKSSIPQIVNTTEASKNTLISSGLKTGSNGIQVQILQSALSNDKSLYPSGQVTGFYGELTKQAVINFQKKYDISTSGEIDKQTADKFNEVYGDKTSDYYLGSYVNNNTSTFTNVINNQNNAGIDPLVNCTVSTNCGGGTRQLKQSICNQSTCCQVGSTWLFYESKDKCIQDQQNYNNQNKNTNVYIPTSQPSQNKVPVFLSYLGYTKYCPSQNVSAVQSIDSTMSSKKSEWLTQRNQCVDNLFNTDSCYLTCKSNYTNEFMACTSTECQNQSSSELKVCFSKCPLINDVCDWVDSERKNLISQIDNLCL